MLDVQLLRSDLEGVAKRLATRGFSAPTEEFLRLEAARKQVQTRTQELQNRRNILAKQVGEAKRKGEDASALMAEAAALPDELKGLEQELDRLQQQLTDLLLVIPNLPHESVPVGKSADDNVEVRRVGEPRRFDFPVKDHVDVGEGLGLLDFERATKISGARFSLMTGAVARLHRALAQFMLDVHTARARLYRSLCAVPGQRRQPARHRQPAEVRRGPVCGAARGRRQALPDPDRRSAGHQHRARRDRRARAAAAQIRLPLALLPQRGGLLRQGHPRHDPPASVRQGRAGADHPSGPVLRRPGAAHRARRRRS